MSDKIATLSVVWKAGLDFETVGREAVRLPVSVQGPGFTPMELVLVGLAGCLGMDVIDILRKKRQAVTALAVQVQGDRAPDHPRKYTAIRIKCVVTGQQVEPEAVRRAIELSETKYCSVAATLRGVAAITTDFEIHAAGQPAL